MKNKKSLISSLQFIVVGILLVVNGLNNYEKFPGAAMVNILIGMGLITICILSRKKRSSDGYIKTLSMLAEGAGLLIAGYIYFLSGKEYLPYPFYLAGFGYFVAAIVKSRKFSALV